MEGWEIGVNVRKVNLREKGEFRRLKNGIFSCSGAAKLFYK